MPDPKVAPSDVEQDRRAVGFALRNDVSVETTKLAFEALARIVAHAEALEAAARRVIEADDEQVMWEVICRCQSADSDAGWKCSNHPDPENARHIPTYGMKEAVALESAMDTLRAALTGPGEPE